MGRASLRQRFCRPAIRAGGGTGRWSVEVWVDRRCWLRVSDQKPGGLGRLSTNALDSGPTAHVWPEKPDHLRRSILGQPAANTQHHTARRLAIYWRRRAIHASSHGCTPNNPRLRSPHSPVRGCASPQAASVITNIANGCFTWSGWANQESASGRRPKEPLHWPARAPHSCPTGSRRRLFLNWLTRRFASLRSPVCQASDCPEEIDWVLGLRLRRPRSPQPGL